MKRIPVPIRPIIIGEFKRLIERVRMDDTSGFDFFENDVFELFDPNEDIECTCGDDEEDNNGMIEADDDDGHQQDEQPNKFMEELQQDAIAQEEDEWEPDDDEFNEEFIRSVTIGVTSSIFGSFSGGGQSSSSAGSQGPALPLSLHEPDCALEQPNFHYKPTGLKIWWNEQMVANQPIKYRALSNIVTHCIASLGRRTEEYMVRGLAFDGEYLDLDRTPPEDEEELEDEVQDMQE